MRWRHGRIRFEAQPEPGPLSPGYTPPEPAPEPEAEPGWAGPSQDEWEAMQAQQAEVLEALGRIAAPFQQLGGQQIPDESPYDPDDYLTAAQVDQLIQARTAELQMQSQAQQMAEADQRAQDILADLAVRDGEFNRDMALALAQRYADEEVQRYGLTPQAAEVALERAANDVRAYEQQVRESGVSQFRNQITKLNEAPREPGVGSHTGAASITSGPILNEDGKPADLMSVVRKFGGIA